MSVRRVDPPVKTFRADGDARLNEVLSIGCGYSSQIGTAWPCGVIFRVWEAPIAPSALEKEPEEKEPEAPPVVKGVPVVEPVKVQGVRKVVCDGNVCTLQSEHTNIPYGAYMVTTKPLTGYYGVGGKGIDLRQVEATSGMRAAQRTMNSLGTTNYANVYAYTSPPSIESEMKRMGATPWNVSSGKIGTAFDPVRRAMNEHYGTGHWTMNAFRIM